MQHKATIFYEWEQGKSAYNFPFPYLSKQFVKVRVDHANASTLLEYNRDYTIEGQTLTFTPVQPFVSGATLCIYRQTPTGSLVDFSDGSLMLASEMDRLSTQLLHVEEENSDLIASTGMFVDDDNAWQGQGRRIKNLSDPQNPQDVVTLNYLDSVDVARQSELQRIETAVRADKESTLSFKNEAASSAQDAAASVSAAAQSAAASEVIRQASAVSESNIKNMQVDVHAIQQHVDEVKTAIDGVAARAKADGQTASDAAVQAQHSAGASAQSAAASEASAVRAETAARFDGVVKSENLAEKSVHKKHLHQDAYESPALTGTPTAPTATKGTSNQQIANTAFVANELADKFDKTGGVINPANRGEGYNEGIRIATASNNWATFILGCKPNTYDGEQVKNGGWGFFRTPANELIIGNRNCVADSAAVAFGPDQKAYFKQTVYAPEIQVADGLEVQGDAGLFFKKHGGGWYMADDNWMRVYGGRGIHTSGKIACDGGFEGNLRGRSDSTNGIAILTGVINDGGTIPLPDGYTESQCRWMVSPKSDNYNLSTWDIDESGGQKLIYTFYCHTEGRKVVCRSRHVGDDGDRTFLGSVNYMIIGVK
ncbi:phage tail fiber protein [uncultured Selenomonas sp.]|uniref:phage tail fiber domain-containing protein n=1 Tax=uncultured Selenomonas sp. TaxID=159275 RepID=UPI002675D90C|nr:phage tail fiber protein [uncultured Selenomonas sp.]